MSSTRRCIDEIATGRTLDAMVAEKVMGYRRVPVPPDYDGLHGRNDVLVPPGFDPHGFAWPNRGQLSLTYLVPNYSSDMGTAWGVFEALTRRGWLVLVKYDPERDSHRWTCFVSWLTADDPISRYGSAQTATDCPMHSICLAAVRAAEEGGK